MQIKLIIDNVDFYDDLAQQISRYVADANIGSDNPDLLITDNAENYDNIRVQYANIPIILLTDEAKKQSDKLNIVLPKPLKLMHLLDIIRSANNKLSNSSDGYLYFNNYELHPNSKEIIDLTDNSIVKLTEREVDIIKYLYKQTNEYISKTDLQTNVWQYNKEVTTHTIETHIYRLRQKVEKNDGRKLIVISNGKYKLNMD